MEESKSEETKTIENNQIEVLEKRGMVNKKDTGSIPYNITTQKKEL